MAKVIDQSIPAGILDSYTKLLLPAKADGHINGTVEKRPPFEQPTWRGFIGNLPTERQIFVRQCFKRSTICFGCQPQTGGVEPPDIGPRARTWWYDECGAYDVDYYRFFMHATISPYFDGWTPDWCKNSLTIGYKASISGEERTSGYQTATTNEEAWAKALTEWNKDNWEYGTGYYEAAISGTKQPGYPSGITARIGGEKMTISFDLKNLPGGDDWEKVEDAWFEIEVRKPTLEASYANSIKCTEANCSHSAQPYLEMGDLKSFFGDDNRLFTFGPGDEGGGSVEPPNWSAGAPSVRGFIVTPTKIKIGYLLK